MLNYTYMRTKQMPDLRNDSEDVTIEHISVLQERLGQILSQAYPGDDISKIVSHHFDPTKMRTEMLDLFTDKAFLAMFKSEMGKGVIIGAFIQKYIFGAEQEETELS